MRGAKPEKALDAHLERESIAPDGASLVVACSGGPDSVALASLTTRLAKAHDWRVVVAHVNHGVRESAWQDECVALSAASRLGVRCVVLALTAASASEAALREGRYAALFEIAEEVGAGAVLTAHTAEDQSETVLLALFRGTGLAGLAGIPGRRSLGPGIELVRPLLRVGRALLQWELGAAGLPWVRDPSNDDVGYRRNSVRAALEDLRAEFPRLDEAVARCAALVAEEMAGTPQRDARRRLRERLAAESGVGLRDVPFERIEAALSAAGRGRGRRVHLKGGIELHTGEQLANARIVRRKD
ncbi:MAG: tRNA lysidine(34) synthetase TilS [Candidatus Eremiobacteraeota bacterium]|nr:tRNA lysidine(34) synthetase TilS [Candidatus Eremiobacteraeota bacterium]MBV8356175.1 tRNA lysidine(34) synthetase TilS [Candidatus Eremiobacteraeota bacterium]